MSERMSEEDLGRIRQDVACNITTRVQDDRRNLVAEIDALRAELDAAERNWAEQEKRGTIAQTDLNIALNKLAAAERERDRAREALAELAQIVGETDHDHSNVENEPCPVCCCLIQANHTLAALKPTPTPDR